MATVQQILNEQDNYSELSIDASFTLQDILQEPPDQDLQAYDNLEEIDDFDAFFQNEEQEADPETVEDPPVNQSIKTTSANSNGDMKTLTVPNLPAKVDPSERNSEQTHKSAAVLRRWARLADLPLPPTQKIRNMVYISLKNVSDLFDITNSQSKGVGVPTCISTSGNKFLALGTSIGNIVVFEIGVKGHRILSTSDQNKYGQATSISISRDNRYIVAGYETGLVILWDLYNFKVAKTILLQKNRILKVLFCSQNFQNFVSSDSEGYLYMYTIQNYLWTGVKTQLLIDKSQNIYYDVKYSKVKSGKQILALSTFNSVLLVMLKPTVSVLACMQRPQGINSNKIPNCQIGQGQQKRNQNPQNNKSTKEDYVCVSWGRYIYVYTLVYSNSQIQKIQKQFIMEQPSGVHNMQFITSGILVTLDNRQVYRAINLETEKQRVKQNEKTIQGSSISVTQLEAQTIYQRNLKNQQGKYIKSYSNTIVSCSYNPRYKQIFLISKNAVYRGRLEKWTDYVHYLLTQQQSWELALKLCLQLYKGNYNIFAEPFIINKTTMNLLCDIGRIFFTERMKEIQSKRAQLNTIQDVEPQVRELYELTIEYFSAIGCEDYMFHTIYKNLKTKYFFQYEEVFISSLQPFIEQSLITRIPSRDTFISIVEKYSQKPQLLNKFIIGLHQDSLYFEDIVEICTRQKLFESLSYICSVNGDFISPANKIIAHLQQHPNDKIQYSNLKQYLNNLIEFKYPNGKPITKHKAKMLTDLSVWLVCDETLRYMVNHYYQDYFEMLSKLGQRLLQDQLINEVPPIAEQVMTHMSVIKQARLMPICLEFLMEIALSNQIHFSQQLLKNMLNSCVQMYDTYKSSEFNKDFKYNNMLKFLQKYLLDKHENIKTLRDQFEAKLLSRLNIWVRLTYKMLSGAERQELLKQSPQLLKNEDPGRDASIGYLFENSQNYREIIEKYQDLLIQWCPEQSLLYMIQCKKNNGIRQININVMKIKDEKLRYAVIRKILRLLRNKNKDIPYKDGNQVGRILKASIQQLHIPALQIISNKLVESTISDDILLFYVKSICKYKKQKRVFYELVQNEEQYRPIVHHLAPIMQEYQYRSCMGFIYEQQLKLKDAFGAYQQVYLEYFEDNFRKLVSHQYCHGRFMAKIFHIMLDLCLRMKIQEQWGPLIAAVLSPLQKQDFTNRSETTKVIDTIQKIYEKKSSKQHPFMQHLIDVIQLTLTSVSRQATLDFMATELNKYTDLLNKSFIVNCLTSTLKGCKKSVETFEISKKLMVTEFVSEFEEFFQINKIRGSPTDNICDQCGLQASSRHYNAVLQQIKFEVLKCGHGYHEMCFKKNYYRCKVCTRKAYGDTKQEQDSKAKLDLILKAGAMTQSQAPTTKEIEASDQTYIFRYIGLDDYRKKEQENFEAFREQYEGYIASYKNM